MMTPFFQTLFANLHHAGTFDRFVARAALGVEEVQ
jgi:hypothetical protein